MDRISELSDELLIKILSFLPTKVAVSTSILARRWECLWMWLPKLDFVEGCYKMSTWKSFRCFLNRSLPLYRAPVIESFCLRLKKSRCKSEDINLWLVIAVSRYLRELEIDYSPYQLKPIVLPSSLYACKSLVTLKLNGWIRLVVPRMVCLPSLKTLQLGGNKYLNGESLRRLLSICLVLEHLSVDCVESSEMGIITVVVPSLQSLSLYIQSPGCFVDALVIDTPSLKYFKLEDRNEVSHSYVVENMPKLEEAYINVFDVDPDSESLIGSITSVKCLTLCLEAVYGDGFVFNQLEHLKLCKCNFPENLPDYFVRLLDSSPNLQVLDIFNMGHDVPIICLLKVAFGEPLISCLKNFNWSRYLGRPQKKDLEVYIVDIRDKKTKIL